MKITSVLDSLLKRGERSDNEAKCRSLGSKKGELGLEKDRYEVRTANANAECQRLEAERTALIKQEADYKREIEQQTRTLEKLRRRQAQLRERLEACRKEKDEALRKSEEHDIVINKGGEA